MALELCKAASFIWLGQPEKERGVQVSLGLSSLEHQ